MYKSLIITHVCMQNYGGTGLLGDTDSSSDVF